MSHEPFQVLGIVCLVASISISWICPKINRIPSGRFYGKLPIKIAISVLSLPGTRKSHGFSLILRYPFGQTAVVQTAARVNGTTCHRQHSDRIFTRNIVNNGWAQEKIVVAIDEISVDFIWGSYWIVWWCEIWEKHGSWDILWDSDQLNIDNYNICETGIWHHCSWMGNMMINQRMGYPFSDKPKWTTSNIDQSVPHTTVNCMKDYPLNTLSIGSIHVRVQSWGYSIWGNLKYTFELLVLLVRWLLLDVGSQLTVDQDQNHHNILVNIKNCRDLWVNP